MSLLSKIPIQSALKNRRIPNAFMLFVKEQKELLVQKCPEESMTVIGTFLGKKWKSMGIEEKQVYYDKYYTLKKHYEDSSDLSSTKAEDSMDTDLINEINEITKTEGMKSDQKIIKNNNKRKFEDSDVTVLNEDLSDTKKYKTRLKSNENGAEISSYPKEKKKSSRFKNPFLIFAKEQRKNIKLTSKKSHVSTILGSMWQDLSDSEKQKYIEKAKRPIKNEGIEGSSPAMGKAKNKTRKKKESKKSVTRSFRNENDTLSLKNTASDKSGKKENLVDAYSESVNADPQLPSTTRHHDLSCHHGSSSNCQQSTYNGFKPSMPQMDLNNSSVVPYTSNMGGFYRPYFGAGMSSLYPPDPFACMPFWMYQQTMVPHHYPFPSPYQSHCHCSFPYHYPPSTSHFRSVIYGRTGGTYPNSTMTTASSSVNGVNGSSSVDDNVSQNVNVPNDVNSDDVSDDSDRLVIVDDVQMEQSNNNESGAHA